MERWCPGKLAGSKNEWAGSYREKKRRGGKVSTQGYVTWIAYTVIEDRITLVFALVRNGRIHY